MDKQNKWTIILARLPLVGRDGKALQGRGTYMVKRVKLNGALIRCTGANLVMLPGASLTLHLDIMPRDLEIITEE